jgi:hypothetical protein
MSPNLTGDSILARPQVPPRASSVTAVLATILVAGCVMNWQAQTATPAQVSQSSGESEIRVTLNTGTNVVVRDPWVEGDSLVGWQQPPGDPSEVPLERRAFALSDVRTVSVRKSNTGANIAIGAAIGAAVFVASVAGAVLIVCGGGGCD